MKKPFSFCVLTISAMMSTQIFAANNASPLALKKEKKAKFVKNKGSNQLPQNTASESTISLTPERQVSTNGTNHLGDLQYMPRTGEINASVELSTRPESVTASFKGKDAITVKESNFIQAYKVNYGINEKMAAGVTLEHFISGKREAEVVQQKKTINTKATGLADPTINGTYRLGTQAINKVNTDLTLSVSPSLIKAEEGSEDKSGSRGRGAMLVQGQVEVGAKLARVDVSANATIGIVGEREIKDIKSAEKYKIDSATTISLGGAVRHEFTETLALKGGLGLTFVPEDKRTQAGETFYKMDSFTRFSFMGEGQYSIVPEKVLAKLQVKINTEGSRTLALGDTKLDVDNSSGQVFLLGTEFLF
ncbi:MAG: hypothetical protein KBD76_08915 [Bacteriovorax sp.]|nr:hypothetical protein [Bacteriovorax sp.]